MDRAFITQTRFKWDRAVITQTRFRIVYGGYYPSAEEKDDGMTALLTH